MTNQEIKVRLIEAFIAQKTPVEVIPSEVDKLLDYINTGNAPTPLQKRIHDFLEKNLPEIQQNNDSKEEKLRKIYFDWYDKMEEPERNVAKANWDYDYCQKMDMPNNIWYSIQYGFDWFYSCQGSDYWGSISQKYKNN